MKEKKQLDIYNVITNGKVAEYKTSAGQNEATAADGGALVDLPTVDVVSPNFMLNSIYDRCKIMNIDSMRNANGITLPKYDVSDVNDGNFWGVAANWVPEGELIPKSTIKFVPKQMKLNKLAVRIPTTNELLMDVPALVGYVNEVGGEALRYTIDRAIIYGNSAYSMGGVVGSDDDATIYVAELSSKMETSQAMASSYYGGQDGIWVLSQDVFNTIVTEFTDNDALSFEGGDKYLYGYPIYVLACANRNTMLLGDFSQYQVVQKELRKDISEHVLFDTDESVIRLVARLQGTPIWNTTMTLANSAALSASAPVELLETIDTERAELLTTVPAGTGVYTLTGTASYFPISATTFNLTVSTDYILVDDGLGGLSASGLPVSGIVDYDTGEWFIDFTNEAVLTSGVEVSAVDFDILEYTASGTLSLVTGASGYEPFTLSMDVSAGAYTIVEVSYGVLGTGVLSTADITGTITPDGIWTLDFTGQEYLTNGVAISATYDVAYLSEVASEVAPFVALSSMLSGDGVDSKLQRI